MGKIFILFIFLFIKIIESRKQLDIPGVTNNIFLAPNSLGLPNEFPSLSPIFNLLLNKTSEIYNEVYNVIQNLQHIIGYFPYSEQEILYKSIKDDLTDKDTEIFDFNKYIRLMEKEIGDGINYFRYQHRSLSYYLTLEAKRYQLGLGCIKKVANDLSYKSKEDEYMMKFITEDINSILNAQNIMNNCTAIFAAEVSNIIEQRKAYLFSITINNMNHILDSNLEKFLIRDDSHLIKGFKYNEYETDIIIKSFKDFSICKQNFNNILCRKTLEAQIEISSMNNCINTEEPNKNAGMSSKKVEEPSITYRKGKGVGINNANKIRTDGRTLNNYLLEYGLGLGKIRKIINKYEKPTFGLPTMWNEFIEMLQIEKIKHSNNEIEEMINKIKDDNGINYKPYPGIIRAVISSIDNANKDEKKLSSLSELLSYFEYPILLNDTTGTFSIKISRNSSSEQLFIEKLNNDIKIGNKEFDIIDSYNIKRKNNLNDDLYPDYIFNSIEIYLSYVNGSTISSGIVIDSLNNMYYDISYNGTSISSNQTHIYSGCISQFSSGGKNDKDACRNNLNIKCGNEIDYRCKESGLYDIILENPISGLILPKECNKGNKKECLKWIDKNLFNYLTLRYSSFSGFSLMIDAASRGYVQETNNQEYIFYNKDIYDNDNNKEEDNVTQRKQVIKNIFENHYLKDFEVEGTGFEKNATIDNLIVEMDRAFSFQVNYGCFISCNKLIIIYLLYFLLFLL